MKDIPLIGPLIESMGLGQFLIAAGIIVLLVWLFVGKKGPMNGGQGGQQGGGNPGGGGGMPGTGPGPGGPPGAGGPPPGPGPGGPPPM